MANLSLTLFGPGVLSLDDQIIRLHSAKTLALLAFLAIESDRPHHRARLAELLWGHCSDASARQSLRQALYSLKTVAGGRLHSCLDTNHELVRFASDPGRERMHALATRNIERLVVERMARSDWDAALKYAEAWRNLDLTSENASRQLFRIFAARNEPHAINAEWSRLRNLLERDLQVEPSSETGELYQALCRGEESKAASGPGHATLLGAAGRWCGDAPPRDASEAESLVRAARAAERVYAFGSAVELYDRTLRVLKRGAPASLARYSEVLLYKEAVLDRLGRRADQASTISEAIGIVESLDDAARLAAVLLREAGVCAYLGNNADAAHAAQRALDIYRSIRDRPGEGEALRELGFVHWRAENYATALHCAREALALHRRLGDVAGEASALHNLAEIHRSLGSPRQALEWYERALQLHWAAQSHEGEILTLFGMANALQQAGDLPGSKQKYEEALKLSERHGERTMQSRALHALAMQCSDEMELETGLRLMKRAVEVDRAIGYAHALGHDLVDLSYIHLLRGERMEACVALQEALVWFGYTEDRDALALARARLDSINSAHAMVAPVGARHWVKSHLPLGEGKVYCEFESPLSGMPRPQAGA